LVALDNHRASDVIGSWLLSEVILTVVALLATARDGPRRLATARDGSRRPATAGDGPRRLATARDAGRVPVRVGWCCSPCRPVQDVLR